MRVLVGDSDSGGDIAEGDEIIPEFLQRRIGVGRLVVGVGVEQRRLLVEHHLLQDRADRLALGEPLAAIAREHGCRGDPVERDEPGDPAIGQAEPVEIVENPRDRHAGESEHRHRAQRAAADRGRKPTCERLVAQDGVEIHRNFGNADAVAPGRDAGMQVGQRFFIVERADFREDRREQINCAVRLLDEAIELLAIGGRARRSGIGAR